MSHSRALIDGDIVAYRAASVTDGRQYIVQFDGNREEVFKYKKDADFRAVEVEGSVTLTFVPEPVQNAYFICAKLMEKILSDTEVETQQTYLSVGGSFRNRLVESYKMNRTGVRLPEHLNACKKYLEKHYDATSEPGEYEADDLMAMDSVLGETIICSVDKDLRQIQGHHYNITSGAITWVDEEESWRNFYSQLLTGDSTDGIVGLKGVGPKTAEKILKGCHTAREMYDAVLTKWGDREQMMLTAQLLYLVRDRGVFYEGF